MIDFGLYLSYVLFVVAIIAAVLLPIWRSLEQPKVLVSSGIAFGILLVLFLVSWAISGGDVTPRQELNFGVTESSSKMIGGGLIMSYLLGIIAIGGVIYSEISRFIK